MPKFSTIVKDAEGRTFKNIAQAPNHESLVQKLHSQGYFIVQVKELSAVDMKEKGGSPQKIKFSHKKISLHDLLTFSRQLATMMEAGVTLTRSLNVIQAQTESQELYQLLVKMRGDIEQGGSLSASMAKFSDVFNQFWISLIEVGEASGTIPTVLNKLAFYLEQQARFRSTIISSLIYPTVLLGVALGAVAFFALFVGPRFESIFKSTGTDLPALTVILLASFKFMKLNIHWIILGCMVIILLLKKYFKTYQGRLGLEKFLFSLPKLGDIYKLIVVERFSSQMAILIDSGVPILYALDICERLVDNNSCALVINKVKESVREGKLLVNTLEQSGFFPPMTIQMISVGEETGELSKMFKHIARFYQDNVEVFMKRFSTLIEPLILIFMGLVMGVLVISMFLPLFNIGQIGGAGG